jgi:AbiU2
MIKVKDSTEFSRLLKALAADIVSAHIHYQLYKDLWQALVAHPRVNIQSQTFWQLTLNAHITTCTHLLCRAYDQETTALHLHNWMLAIRENLHLFHEEEFRQRLKDNPFVDSLAQSPRKPDQMILEEDIRLCSPDDPLVKTLIIHRNSHVAHRSAKNIIAERNIYDDYPLTSGDFEALLARAKTILNRYSSLFAAISYATQIVGYDDYQYIFRCIEEKLQRTEEELQRTEEELQEPRQARRSRCPPGSPSDRDRDSP